MASRPQRNLPTGSIDEGRFQKMVQDMLSQAQSDFFDLSYVRKMNPELADTQDAALIDLLLSEDTANPPAPNCIFDVRHYNKVRAEFGQGGALNPIRHFLTERNTVEISVNPLFDAAFYRRNTRGVDPSGLGAIVHALAHFDSGLASFCPFVDVGYICAQTGRNDAGGVARDLLRGALQVDRPHPLVDLEYIRSQATSDLDSMKDAIWQCWAGDLDLATHPLIDVAYYKAQGGTSVGIAHSAYHYLVSRTPRSPHALFDPVFYRGQVIAKMGYVPPRLLEHFVTHGQAAGLAPSPFFDTTFYQSQAGSENDALQHYILGGHRHHAPHPMISADDAQLYAIAVGRSDKPVAQALAECGSDVSLSMTPEFDAQYYLSHLDMTDMDPIALRDHYFRFGYPAGVRPNDLYSMSYIAARCGPSESLTQAPLGDYFTQGLNHSRRILLALRTMEDTSANQSWLRLCESQRNNPDIEMIVTSVTPGPLSDAFLDVAHVWYLDQKNQDDVAPNNQNNATETLAKILSANPAEVALVDCADGRTLLQELTLLGAPIMAVVPAELDHLSSEDRSILTQLSSQILCHSNTLEVDLQSEGRAGGPQIVTGFHTKIADSPISIKQRQRVRLLLGLEEDDILVVSSGGPTIEHGSDLFGALAAQCSEDVSFSQKAVFLWHGAGAFYGNHPKFYARHFAQTSMGKDGFHMRDDIDLASVLAAADIYVKLGREGCDLDHVVQAQSRGLPTVVMKEAGAADTFSTTKISFSFDAFDLAAARTILHDLVDAPQTGMGQGATARTEEHSPFSLGAFVARVNDAIMQLVPGLALQNAPETMQGKLLLALPDADLFEAVSSVPHFERAIRDVEAVWVDHTQMDGLAWPAKIKSLVEASGCGEIAVVRSAAQLSPQEIAGFHHSIWLTQGTSAEVSELYLSGLEFDEILTRHADQITEMRALNPRIADMMGVLDWGTV